MKESVSSNISKFPQEGEKYPQNMFKKKKIGEKYDPNIEEKALWRQKQRLSQAHSNKAINAPMVNSVFVQRPVEPKPNRTWDEKYKLESGYIPHSGKVSQYSRLSHMKDSRFSVVSGVSAQTRAYVYSNKPGWRVYETFKPEYRSGYHGQGDRSNSPQKDYLRY